MPGLTLARIGGHFDGAAVLHWPAGSGGRGALLTGDTITVVPDRDWVSFMWSYPNHIPLDEVTVLDIAERAGRFGFDRVYGGWWGRVVRATTGRPRSAGRPTGTWPGCAASGPSRPAPEGQPSRPELRKARETGRRGGISTG